LGGGIRNPEDALVVGKRAMELGFTSTVGIIHDGDGQLRPLATREREVFLEMKKVREEAFFADQLFSGSHRQRAA